MQKKILSAVLVIVLITSLVLPIPGVSADAQKADISDYTPVTPPGIDIGTIYSTSFADITLSATTSGIWKIAAAEKQTSVPDDYQTPMGGGYWIPPCAELGAGTYVLSFNARNKSPQGIAANAVFGLFDGSMGGSAAGWGWKGQYAWAQEIASDEWTKVSKTFTTEYNATGTSEKSNARLKIGLGTGNTFSQFALKENFDFRPGAAMEIDISTIYLAKECAYDVVNTTAVAKTIPGATFVGNAKVVNQLGDKGSLDQGMEYFVTDTLGNVTDAMTVAEGSDGAYTVAVAEDAADGQYVITARSRAYNTDKTRNFMQDSAIVTVSKSDYGDVFVAIEPEELGEMTKLTDYNGDFYDYGVSFKQDGTLCTFTAKESRTTIPNGIARPAGGVEWKFNSGKKGQKFVLSLKVRKNNTTDVTPNLVYGLGDGSMGGSVGGWVWKTQTYYVSDITSSDWQTITQEITLPCDTTANTVVTLGLGAGCSHDEWAGKTEYAFRPGGSVVVDMDSFALAEAGVCRVTNEATSSVNVFAGETISARAEVVNALGTAGSLDQTLEYVVLDSASRKKMAEDITITAGQDGAYTINVGENAAAGEYVAVATNTTNGTTVRTGLEFSVEAVYNPPADYAPLMWCALDGDILSVRTGFDDTHDLLQKIKGITADSLDSNNPVDFVTSGLVQKDDPTMTAVTTVLCNGVDEATPFKFNFSNIGANHGQSNGILATSPSHGKTYADIGSLWQDSAGAKWNLIKIVDSDKLFFLSENFTTNINKYYFKNSMSGVLRHVECAENTADITISSAQTSQQVYPSNQKIQKTVYIVADGQRHILPDKASWGCDYVEIVEKYNVMNPALIGRTLRANRPAGGYTEPQNIAIGSPLVSYSMVYRIMPDGTVFSIFDHEILEDINFEWYGAQQTIARLNAFGGGVYRYIPKLREFTFSDVTADFRVPVNMTELSYSSSASFQLTRELWENDTPPDRQIEYFRDNNASTVASFVGGFLPILDGEPAVRGANINAAGFVYKSKKTYPYFVDSAAFASGETKGRHIRGVAYKKYSASASDDISYYTVGYNNDIYLYVDCHKICTKEIDLSDVLVGASSITRLEKTDNVTYTQSGGKLTVSMDEGVYGYLVLCVSRPAIEPVAIRRDAGVSVSIKNNTHTEQNARLVLGFYDTWGKLIGAKAQGISAGDYQTFSYTTSDVPDDTAEVRAFLWDSGFSVRPLAGHIKE